MTNKKTPKKGHRPDVRPARIMQNSVKRPLALWDGRINPLARVWEIADKISAEKKKKAGKGKAEPATRAEVLSACRKARLTYANFQNGFYPWRRFNGLFGGKNATGGRGAKPLTARGRLAAKRKDKVSPAAPKAAKPVKTAKKAAPKAKPPAKSRKPAPKKKPTGAKPPSRRPVVKTETGAAPEQAPLPFPVPGVATSDAPAGAQAGANG